MDAGINLIIAGLMLGMTYALASEGLWGAALMFFNVLIGGLIAFNFYEPLAQLVAENASILAGFADAVCLLVLFIASVTILRLTTETIGPAMVRFPTPLFHLGRWFFAALASMLTLAILLLGFDAAPVHKKIFGVIDYKTLVPFGLGLERQWLGLFQYATGQIFVTHTNQQDPFGQYRDAKVFDPRAEWLLLHQEARPYGTESILSDDGGGGGAGAPAQGGAGAPAQGGGGAPAPGGPGGPRGDAGGDRPGDPKVVGPAVGGGVVLPQ
jgi:hypothetical protein